LFGFEFLQADDVGLGAREPFEKIVETFVDVVDVEGCDLHVGLQSPNIDGRRFRLRYRRDVIVSGHDSRWHPVLLLPVTAWAGPG
jgi:hypothetical protein